MRSTPTKKQQNRNVRGWGRTKAIWAGGLKDRFDRLRGRYSDLDQVLGEAMDLLAPRSLSLSLTRQRARRENDMPRYSSDTPERDDQGRFTSDNDRGSSRGRGGSDGTNPDVLRVKVEARAAVPMRPITDRATATSPDDFRARNGARPAVTMTMITDRAVGTSPGAS
jgi:hypothetical protein